MPPLVMQHNTGIVLTRAHTSPPRLPSNHLQLLVVPPSQPGVPTGPPAPDRCPQRAARPKSTSTTSPVRLSPSSIKFY
ncbi:unnamed protein product [Chrysoparadoxa australica]